MITHRPAPSTNRRPRLLLAGVAVIGAALLAGCTEDVTSEQVAADGGDPGAALDLALEELVELPGGPTGAIALVDDGSGVEVHRAGTADALGEEGEPPDQDASMRIASVSKAFSGAIAASLVTDGLLEWSSTIGELLPDLPTPWHEVTLRQLLDHTSGVPDYGRQPAFAEAFTASPTEAPEPRELLTYVPDELDFESGSKYVYSNSENIVVGLMAEAATGQPYRDLLRERVTEPLGLEQTFLPGPDEVELPDPHLAGSIFEDDQREDVTDVAAWGGWAWASGGIVSTPAELQRFVTAYVSGELASDAARGEQLRFRPDSSSEPEGPGSNAAGPALFQYTTDCGVVYGHTGSILGYTQFVASTLDGERSVTFTINVQVDDEQLPHLRAAEELAVCAALAD